MQSLGNYKSYVRQLVKQLAYTSFPRGEKNICMIEVSARRFCTKISEVWLSQVGNVGRRFKTQNWMFAFPATSHISFICVKVYNML